MQKARGTKHEASSDATHIPFGAMHAGEGGGVSAVNSAE